MIAGKFDPQRFFDGADNIALNVSASEVFGLLTRTLDLPGFWAALITRTAGDQIVVQPGANIPRAGAEDIMFVRVSPVDVSIETEGLVSRDHFQGNAAVDVKVSVVPEAGDLQSFQKHVLGSHRVVQTKAIARYLEPTVRAALMEVAAKLDGKELVGPDALDQLATAVADALKAPCFSGGLRAESRPVVRIDSASLRGLQKTQQETARRRAEHDTSLSLKKAIERAQGEHLDHLAEMLDRLSSLATASPDVDLPVLLQTFTEQQRGELYEALFATDAAVTETRWIVVAVGHELLFFEPKDPSKVARRVPIEGTVGAVRSVQTAGHGEPGAVLWLGAATGVYRLPLDAKRPDLTLSVPGAPSVRGGFNAVAACEDRVFASHSELGLYEWRVDKPDSPRRLLESMTKSSQTVRAVCATGGQVYCAIDDRVICMPIGDGAQMPSQLFTGSDCSITSLCVSPSGVFAGNSRGDVLRWSGSADTDPEIISRGGGRAAESIWHLATQGVDRLIFSDTSICIRAQVLGDSFVCRYEAGGQTLRRVEAVADQIVATNELRDRLFCWTPGHPARPANTIPVSRMCSQSIQDFCLV
ncbi:MAG: hypothetical protein IH987_00650 [Planctomycetes bacterium]|nr:hypothetical protein [Planctomycetota bacterium]